MGIFSSVTTRTATLRATKAVTEFLGTPLTSFQGCNQAANKLNQPYGQLVYNKNMEYLFSGTEVYLKTRRGSTLIADITNRPYGGTLYTYNLTPSHFVWIDGSGVKYCLFDGTGTATTATPASLTPYKYCQFVMYGQSTNAALYGANGSEAVFKISGSTPNYSAVALAPIVDTIAMGTLVGRLFGAKGHTVYWTEVQTGTGTANLDTWNTGTNTAIVSPDSGAGITRIIDLGIDGIYFFKDTGIWVLPNANEATPTTNWRFPKCKADIGTTAPNTVCTVNYGGVAGIIYLGSDKTLRFFNPSLQDNAGSIPAITTSDSKIISDPFQLYLSNIPDAYISLCSAVYHGNYYILNYMGADETELTKTIIVDTEKLIASAGGKIAQPYWFESKNLDFNSIATNHQTNKLYGFNVNGYITEALVLKKFYDEMPTRLTPNETFNYLDDSGSIVSLASATRLGVAIEYSAYTAWHDFSSLANGRTLELTRGYLNWKSGALLVFSIGAMTRGDRMPDYTLGNTGNIQGTNDNDALYDVSLFDVAIFDSSSSSSQNVYTRNIGHLFNFGFSNTEYNKPAEIYGIDPIFKQRNNNPVGKR